MSVHRMIGVYSASSMRGWEEELICEEVNVRREYLRHFTISLDSTR